MPDSKAKMLQIVCQSGLGPRPNWGAYSTPPDCWLDFRGLLLREGRGEDGKKIEQGILVGQ